MPAKAISAAKLSSEVHAAVQKVLAGHRELAELAAKPEFVIAPHSLIGFILRDNLKKTSLSDLQGIAADVTGSLGSAAGASPAALIHGKDLIVGFIPDLNRQLFRE